MPSLYKFEVKKSEIEGLGVFALEDIPYGVVTWVFKQTNQNIIPIQGYQGKPNQTYTQAELQNFENKQSLVNILSYGLYYADQDIFVHLKDGTQYTNHSSNANTQTYFHPNKDINKSIAISLRDIKKGEQITQNYQSFLSESEWIGDLMKKYLPQRDNFEQIVKKQ